MKDALRGALQVVVVAIDGSRVLCSVVGAMSWAAARRGLMALVRSTSRATMARSPDGRGS
jgi:hypothetical protein